MNNYKVTRIGLLNFWYFDDEEFNFFDGKLLLRGENGSGKSITMQSFIPLILDGNRAPNRLDPFGTKEKKIEDYLLGPSDGEQKEDSIGYLYMETYNDKLDKYITVGMGLHARKGRPTEFWGFAIKNGLRIGRDFQLYKNYAGKVLMTKKELKANIGPDNEFTESTKEYKQIVNSLLFGFKDIDSYDEFINVLLQLRSSKLSKDYNPNKLMDILSSVLQPLTDDDIRPLSEAIEDNNKTKEKIDSLRNSIKALSNLVKVYTNYNETILYSKAESAHEEEEIIKNKKNDIANKENEIKKISSKLEDIKTQFKKLEKEQIDISSKLETIDNQDLKKLTEERNKLDEEIDKINNIIKEINLKIERYTKESKNYANKIEEFDNKIYHKDKEILDIKENIASLADEVKLTDVSINIKDSDVNIQYLTDRVSKYRDKINQIKLELEEKEALETTLNQVEEELLKIKKIHQEKEKNVKLLKGKLQEEIDNFKDQINKLDKENNVINFDIERKRKIFDLINNYNHDNYIIAKEEYQKEIRYYERNAVEEKNNLENKINNESIILKQLNEELISLNSTKELEFIEEESLKESENKLNNLNIPFIPLYKVIEFKKDIKENERNKIEELLISMNILNAKIVSKKDLKNVKGIKSVFLKPGLKKQSSLLNYFDILDNDIVSKKEIEDILSSISTNKLEQNHITKDDFESDFLIGYPGDKYQSKYIGMIKRIDEQRKKIAAKEEEIKLKTSIINNYKNILETTKNKINQINYLFDNFPNNKLLEEISKSIDKELTSLEIIYEQDKDLTEKITNITQNIKLKIEHINMIKENISIPLNLVNYKNAINLIEELIKEINNLKYAYNSINGYKDQKISMDELYRDKQAEIDYQNAELVDKNREKTGFISKRQAIEEVLSKPDYQELIQELSYLTQRQKKIPEEREELSKEEGGLEKALESLSLSISEDKLNLDKSILRLDLKMQLLKNEYKLNYIYQNDEINIQKILTDLSSRKNSDLQNAITNYISAYNNYRQELLEYRLTTKEIFVRNEDIIKYYKENGLEEHEINLILNSAKRQDMTSIYHGKILNIYELIENLKQDILESENYITAQEHHIFEDILLKTVGSKIRDKIESSKEWVKKINEIMKNTQIDSNLSFELEWRSISAYSEEQLDTKEIVRLLKIDAGQLDEKDSNKLFTHFQSQIAKELEYNDKMNDSYSNIIFKVLDYRNWFEFKIYYKRKCSEKRELTNKVFSVLSGGERAKSMYVPLFAAIYAKLLSAKDSALRLIALDEAFAGVDNNNIREMFDILSQLNLDYILTSQALWGDYATIKELSICELIKDEIHKAVAVRHYKWNGHTKKILEKSEYYE